MGDTSRSATIETQLREIAEQAVRYPQMIFTTLAHRMDVDFLREAYRRTRKDGAPGVDRVTAKEYAVNLEQNLTDLHERLKSGRYVAPPVERAWLDKDGGGKRPIGKPTFEDKIVQRAVAMLRVLPAAVRESRPSGHYAAWWGRRHPVRDRSLRNLFLRSTTYRFLRCPSDKRACDGEIQPL